MSARSVFGSAPAYLLPATAGTATQVIVSDGAGGTAWGTAGSDITTDTIAQTTGPTNPVTLNSQSGYVTTYSQVWAPGTQHAFKVNCNKVLDAHDLVTLSISNNPDLVDGTKGYMLATCVKVEIGAFYILLQNVSTINASSNASFTISFNVHNAV
jgi:hypothetical protein